MKKWSILAAVVLVICLMTACGSKKPAETAGTESKEETAQEAEEAAGSEAAEPEAGTAGSEGEAAPAEDPAQEADDNAAFLNPDEAEADAFCGIWQCDRATVKNARKDADYKCFITWGGSASERACWEYDCYFDGKNLVSFETGIKKHQTFGENGELKEEEVVFSDGAVSLGMTGEGNLTWTDFKEDAGAGMEFTRMGTYVFDPDPQELYEEYFLIVGAFHEGTSGSSLARARAACSAVRFASVHELCLVDTQTLRDSLLEAWEEMTEDEQAQFDANFMSVVTLLDDCIEDFEANRGLLEDADVAEQMRVLLGDPISLLSWQTLRDHTLTMGNSDGE